VLTVGGHIVSEGVAPEISIGTALGTVQANISPNAEIEGTDTAASVGLSSGGQAQTAGILAHIEFNESFSDSYRVVVTAANEHATDLRVYVIKSADGFDIVTKDIPLAGTNYQFDYIIISSNGS
jgi:hypothetical protein